jgi:hypothetical protein
MVFINSHYHISFIRETYPAFRYLRHKPGSDTGGMNCAVTDGAILYKEAVLPKFTVHILIEKGWTEHDISMVKNHLNH